MNRRSAPEPETLEDQARVHADLGDEPGPSSSDGPEATCPEVGRDPATIGRSAGVEVAPLARAEDADAPPGAISGTTEEIADAFRTFGAAGFTRLELMISPQTSAALDAMAPVLELLASD
jgi:hypothetical protein